MPRRMVSLIVALIIIGEAVGQNPGNDQPAFTRFIGPKTMLFVYYRAGELLQIPAVQSMIASVPGGKDQMEKDFQKDLGINVAEVDTVTMYVDQLVIVNGQPQPSRPPYLLLTARKNLDFTALRRTLGTDHKTTQIGKYELTTGSKAAMVRIDDRSVLVFPDSGCKEVNMLKNDLSLLFAGLETGGDVPPRWKQIITIAAAQKHPFFMGFQISDELSQLAEEGFKQAPPMAAPFKALTKVQSGYMAMNYVATQAEDCLYKIVMHFPDFKSAQAGLGAVKFGIASGKMAISSMGTREAPRNLENFWAYSAGFAKKQLELIKPEQKENEVIINYPMNSKEFLPVVTLAIEKVRVAADKMLSASNMRQLMIAMHNYHNDYLRLPEVMTLKEGKLLHSWRVSLLPYIEEEKLYKQLRLDEPWDSDHNKRVFESNPMPKLFEHPQKKDGASKLTYYQVFYSTTAAKKPAGLRLGVKLTLGQLAAKDGNGHTVAMVELGKPVLWFKPEDIEFDAAAGFPKLTSIWPGNRMQVAFFDGSIRTFNLDLDEAIWKALVTWDGGEKIDFSKIEE